MQKVSIGATAIVYCINYQNSPFTFFNVIKRALAGDRGEIAVMEPSSIDGKGVIIGYSSGAVVQCYADNNCRAFDGTPASTLVGGVTAIAVSRRGNGEEVWVAYQHGILYRCADYFCREVLPENSSP